MNNKIVTVLGTEVISLGTIGSKDNNSSEDLYKDTVKIMRDNGYKDAARYMQMGDYDKMIEIMNDNGYEYMGKMMKSIGIESLFLLCY